MKETTDSCIAAQTELSELKLKNAEEKEKLYVEMQQLASALVTTREQMKEAKETELQLRELIKVYETKFNGLQNALTETNSAYQTFQSEMGKVGCFFFLHEMSWNEKPNFLGYKKNERAGSGFTKLEKKVGRIQGVFRKSRKK